MKKKESFSKKKFEERILNELNLLLRTKLTDPRVQFVSLTSVDLNNDFSVATIYWDTFNAGTRGDASNAMKGMSGKLRTELSKVLKLRHTPALNFLYDSQFEDANKISALLKSAQESDS